MATKFNFSMGALAQRADHVTNLFIRDANEFASKGYDDTFRVKIVQETIDFKALQPDEYFLGLQMVATNNKDKAASDLTELLEGLRLKAKYALGDKSVEYKTLRINKLKDQKPEDLLPAARHITTTARAMLDKLAAKLVTEESLLTIDAASQKLDDAIDEQKKAISIRMAATQEREQKANALYNLVSEACEVGKEIWDGTNQAYYNDYVIYGSKEEIPEDAEV